MDPWNRIDNCIHDLLLITAYYPKESESKGPSKDPQNHIDNCIYDLLQIITYYPTKNRVQGSVQGSVESYRLLNSRCSSNLVIVTYLRKTRVQGSIQRSVESYRQLDPRSSSNHCLLSYKKQSPRICQRIRGIVLTTLDPRASSNHRRLSWKNPSRPRIHRIVSTTGPIIFYLLPITLEKSERNRFFTDIFVKRTSKVHPQQP